MKYFIVCCLIFFNILSIIHSCPSPKASEADPNILIENSLPDYLTNLKSDPNIIIYKLPSGVESNYNTINLVLIPDQIFNISISANPSTGYSWHIHHQSGELNNIAPIVDRQMACEYISFNEDSNKLLNPLIDIAIAGTPGVELWTFKIKSDAKIGDKAIIPLTYNRVWMSQPSKPSITFNINIGTSNTDPKNIVLIPEQTDSSSSTQSNTTSTDDANEYDDYINEDQDKEQEQEQQEGLNAEQEKSEQYENQEIDNNNNTNQYEEGDKALQVDVDVEIEETRRRRRLRRL